MQARRHPHICHDIKFLTGLLALQFRIILCPAVQEICLVTVSCVETRPVPQGTAHLPPPPKKTPPPPPCPHPTAPSPVLSEHSLCKKCLCPPDSSPFPTLRVPVAFEGVLGQRHVRVPPNLLAEVDANTSHGVNKFVKSTALKSDGENVSSTPEQTLTPTLSLLSSKMGVRLLH